MSRKQMNTKNLSDMELGIMQVALEEMRDNLTNTGQATWGTKVDEMLEDIDAEFNRRDED